MLSVTFPMSCIMSSSSSFSDEPLVFKRPKYSNIVNTRSKKPTRILGLPASKSSSGHRVLLQKYPRTGSDRPSGGLSVVIGRGKWNDVAEATNLTSRDL